MTDTATRGGRTKPPRKTVAQRLAEEELTEVEATELARDAALRTLTAAPKSRSEVAASLARKGYPTQIVEPLLNRLEVVGLIDDPGYAQMIVRTRSIERGMSRRAIAAELRKRGIGDTDASRALSAIDDEAEKRSALCLAQKLANRGAGLDPEVRLRRLVAALGRRGYSPGNAYSIARVVLAESLDEIPAD